MILTPTSLLRMAPNVGNKVGIYTGVLNQALERFGIDTPKRVAFFLGQLLVESGDLQHVREGMNYSAERLMAVWPKRFPTIELARMYERNPQKLANFVYANRMGNGDFHSGDGWKHRGAGWIQLTGKDNQEECARALDIKVEDVGNWLASTSGAALSAGWYWWKTGANRLADFGNHDAVSDTVNLGRRTEKVGDAIDYKKRVACTNGCLKELGA